MYEVLKEIRDNLRSNLDTSHTAESGTTTTNVKVTAHGLKNGDNIVNVTRANAKRAITVVDANNFTVDAIAAQTSGDTLTFEKFKHYYIGDINDNIPINYLPALCIYGNSTVIQQKSTTTDRWLFDVTIEAFTNSFANVSINELTDDILVAQKELQDIFEERNANHSPKNTTVLGIIRKYIQGNNYLYNDDIVINYDRHLVNGKVFYKAKMQLKFYVMSSPRT